MIDGKLGSLVQGRLDIYILVQTSPTGGGASFGALDT